MSTPQIVPNTLKSIERDAKTLKIDFGLPGYQFTLWGIEPDHMTFCGGYPTLEDALKAAAGESVHVVQAEVHSNGAVNLMLIQPTY